MHQARPVVFAATSSGLLDTALEVLVDALARLAADINGDDRTANNPTVPTDFVINCRLLKFLSFFFTKKLLSLSFSWEISLAAFQD
jgi:hypothetical protein